MTEGKMSWRPIVGAVLALTVCIGCVLAITLDLIPARFQPWLGVLLLAGPYLGTVVALSGRKDAGSSGERT